MRRVLALVALLATAGPQVTVMGCVIGPTPSLGSHASSMASEHTHDGPECRALMTCNVAMIEAVTASHVARPAAPAALHPRPMAESPSTHVLTAEPPPPRRRA